MFLQTAAPVNDQKSSPQFLSGVMNLFGQNTRSNQNGMMK